MQSLLSVCAARILSFLTEEKHMMHDALAGQRLDADNLE